MLAAMTPESSVDLAALTAKQIKDGYGQAGFLQATVTCKRVIRERGDQSARSYRCMVNEGPRYRWGELEMEGPTPISKDKLIREIEAGLLPPKTFPQFWIANGDLHSDWFTLDKDNEKGRAKRRPAVWRTGDPAAKGIEQELENAIKQVFSGSGYANCKFQIESSVDDESHQVHVVVKVTSKGLPTEVASFRVNGLTQQTRADVIAYLNLKRGDLVNHDMIFGASRKLFESARFAEYRIEFDPVDRELRFDLKEVSGATSLSKPLTKMERAFLSAGRTLLEDESGATKDLFFQTNDEDTEYALCIGQAGAVVYVSHGTALDRQSFTLAIDQQRILITASWMPSVYICRLGEVIGRVVAPFSLRGTPSKDRLTSLNIDGCLGSVDQRESSAVQMEYRYRPADWMAILHHKKFDVQEADGLIQIGEENRRIAIDAASGRLASVWGYRVEEFCQLGAVQKYLDDVNDRIEHRPVVDISQRSLSGLAEFFTHRHSREFLSRVLSRNGKDFHNELRGPNGDALEDFVKAEGFEVLDQVLNLWIGKSSGVNQKDADTFEIDGPKGSWSLQDPRSITPFLPQLAKRYGLEGWPYETMQAVFVLVDDSTTKANQDRVLNAFSREGKHGPLAHLALAWALSYLQHPSDKIAAARSVERMNPQEIRREIDQVLTSPLGEPLRRSIQAFASLSKEQREHLISLVPMDSWRTVLRTHAIPSNSGQETIYKTAQRYGREAALGIAR